MFNLQCPKYLYSISIGCTALTPVPSSICWRHDVPGAATKSGTQFSIFNFPFSIFLTAGKSTISPMANEVL